MFIYRTTWFVYCCALALLCCCSSTVADDDKSASFKPGDRIEAKQGSDWFAGVVVSVDKNSIWVGVQLDDNPDFMKGFSEDVRTRALKTSVPQKHLRRPAKQVSAKPNKQAVAKPTATFNPEAPVLKVRHLSKTFRIRKADTFLESLLGGGTTRTVRAVNDVSFDVMRGECLGLVGESGCGKTTIGKSILQLIQPTAGSVQFHDQELVALKRKPLQQFRSQFQIIFQDPYSSLNPRMRVYEILEEGMNALQIANVDHLGNHEAIAPRDKPQPIDILLQQVGLPTEAKWRFPHEFSGGQRQRIAIARALAVNPKLLVCDEPTSALDVSVQAQILNLLKSLQNNLGLAFLFITHNIAVVEYLADEVAVMYLGRIVERGRIDEVMNDPKHPYTQALLSSVPQITAEPAKSGAVLKGDLPSPAAPPTGCHFNPRCAKAMPICRERYPAVSKFSATHTTHCYLYTQEQHS